MDNLRDRRGDIFEPFQNPEISRICQHDRKTLERIDWIFHRYGLQMRPTSRLRSITHKVHIQTSADGVHELDIAIGYDASGYPLEIAFVGRGKFGHGIDQMMANLGIALSRILQFRNGDTGEDIPE